MSRHVMAAAAVAFAMVPAAHGAEQLGGYFGLTAGAAEISRDLGDGVEWNSNKFAWGAQVGWQAHENFAIELGYLKPATDRQSAIVDGDLYEIAAKTSGFTATAIFSFPVGEGFALHGRVGALRARENYQAWINDVSQGNFSDTTTEVIYGGGISKAFNRTRLRLEYQRAEFEFGDVGLFSFSVNWLFPSGR